VKIGSLIEQIETQRQSRVLVLAASNLELDLLPSLYDVLHEMGRTERLDVLFYCRGGIVNAARRVALLLHEFTDHLTLIVPDRCESSGTIVALAAHEIIAGQVAVFSPIDPLLQAGSPTSEQGPLAISAQDVRLFGEMTQQWFGVSGEEAKGAAMTILCESIFPTTLTSFYRSCLETRGICLELRSLATRSPEENDSAEVVDRLLYGHHSHTYALTREDMATLGLPMRADAATEDLAWEVARTIRGSIGAGGRVDPDESWTDTIVATRTGGRCRRRSPAGVGPQWESCVVE
tara:strand:- start:7161 stop:8033 length:873 start_codon:yes stop_codon:yes gene_type:complete